MQTPAKIHIGDPLAVRGWFKHYITVNVVEMPQMKSYGLHDLKCE